MFSWHLFFHNLWVLHKGFIFFFVNERKFLFLSRILHSVSRYYKSKKIVTITFVIQISYHRKFCAYYDIFSFCLSVIIGMFRKFVLFFVYLLFVLFHKCMDFAFIFSRHTYIGYIKISSLIFV